MHMQRNMGIKLQFLKSEYCRRKRKKAEIAGKQGLLSYISSVFFA